MTETSRRLRELPSVDALASRLQAGWLTAQERVSVAREAIDLARSRIVNGEGADAKGLADELSRVMALRTPTRMVNATGVILHTNLGRAPLSPAAGEAAARVSSGYSNTELDRVDGTRGTRGWHTTRLLRLLTGAEDALVVNNNAAAVLLSLSSLAQGRAVPVSRGELIEIGGSYRLPDVMLSSGARLVEVGTTNRTRRGDFVTALQVHDCGLVLKVHHANYEMSGFVSEVGIAELAEIANVPVVFDIGSGLLDKGAPWLPEPPDWVRTEPGARQALEAGADLVLFSGDKMLGGPQAGVIVGRGDLIDMIKENPIARAVRIDSATDAAMAATLQHYIDSDLRSIPFWRMALLQPDELKSRAHRLADAVGGEVETGHSLIGAGSAPGARLESPVLRVGGRQDAFEPLLHLETPVLVRREAGDLLVDLRTVDPDDDDRLAGSLVRCL